MTTSPAKMPYPWLFENLTEGKNYVLPAGKYYIGDIFTVIKPDIYDESFNETGHKSGLYKCIDGYIIVSEVAETNGYEGTYTGSDDFEYSVNSGCIGIVSTALIKNTLYEGGQVYDFPDDVNVIIDSGRFTFETGEFILHIDTAFYGPEEESETEDLCYAFSQVMTTEMDIDM
jgi:hypothetical protein